MEIGDEIQLCLAALWKRTKKRPTVIGHSAGGHLTAEMLARDWIGFAGVPADPEPEVDIPTGTPSTMIYTSGTTGKPKGALRRGAGDPAQVAAAARS